jgi:DNA polymerase
MKASIADLADQAVGCRACDLWSRATQVVFGTGPASARLLLVGEPPGDVEDRSGAPCVGAAGRLLDDAIEAADLDRRELYVTNAVKHFKWKPRGKRRIHQVLRDRDREQREAAFEGLVAELRRAKSLLS